MLQYHVCLFPDGLLTFCDRDVLPLKAYNWTMASDTDGSYGMYNDRRPGFLTVHVPDIPDTSAYYFDPYSTVAVQVPNMTTRVAVFSFLDVLVTVFFTVDLLLRLLSCPCLVRYFTSIINITDALALIATFIHVFIQLVNKHNRFVVSWLDILEYMLVLRSLRLFRLISNTNVGRVLGYTVYNNVRDLMILGMFLICGMCTFASLVYISERDEEYGTLVNITEAWYWAVITMTTVGYGDIVPTTKIGRVVACMTAMSGVIMFALTVPIFAGHFMTLYQYLWAESTVRQELKKRRPNAVVTVAESETGQRQ